MRPFFIYVTLSTSFVNSVTDAECNAIAEAMIGTIRIHQEVIQRTSVKRQLNRHILRIPFSTTLHTS